MRRASLAPSLACSERLLSTPSTSSSMATRSLRDRRRSLPLRNVISGRSTNGHASKKRPVVEDAKLNTPQFASVRSCNDVHIQNDDRCINNMRETEELLIMNVRYTAITPTITAENRATVVEWMKDVLKEEKAEVDVFPLAVLILDLYMCRQEIHLSQIQACASACVVIASKLKAPVPISAVRVSYFTDGSVPPSAIISFELLVLRQLRFNILLPTALDFEEQVLSRAPVIDCPSFRSLFAKRIHQMQLGEESELRPSEQCAMAALSLGHVAFRHLLPSIREAVACLGVSVVEAEGRVASSEWLLTPMHALEDSSLLLTPSSISDIDDLEMDIVPAKNSPPETPVTDSGFNSAQSSPESLAAEPMHSPSPSFSR